MAKRAPLSNKLTSATWWLKACPKCGGDLHEDFEYFGVSITCFQCGRVLRSDEEMALRSRGRPSAAGGLAARPARPAGRRVVRTRTGEEEEKAA